MKSHLKIIVFTFLTTSIPLIADDVTTKESLTLDGAKKAADAAIAYAKSNGAPGSAIAVVDEGGHLLYFVRSTALLRPVQASPLAKRRLLSSSKNRPKTLRISSTKAASP